jgi:hypothetical protein
LTKNVPKQGEDGDKQTDRQTDRCVDSWNQLTKNVPKQDEDGDRQTDVLKSIDVVDSKARRRRRQTDRCVEIN